MLAGCIITTLHFAKGYILFNFKKCKNEKVILVCTVATAVVCYGVGVLKSELTLTDLVLSDVESIAACESIGWWNNNGNCVKNDKDVYFCKSDSWPALTDCLQ